MQCIHSAMIVTNSDCVIGHTDICRYLLDKAGERKQSLANAVTSSGNTPLMWACSSGSIEVAKLLISAGADPSVCNNNGANAAHWAAHNGSVEMCKYLHDELGLEFQGPGTEDKDGKAPLDTAMSCGHADVVEWIAYMTQHELSESHDTIQFSERRDVKR